MIAVADIICWNGARTIPIELTKGTLTPKPYFASYRAHRRYLPRPSPFGRQISFFRGIVSIFRIDHP